MSSEKENKKVVIDNDHRNSESDARRDVAKGAGTVFLAKIGALIEIIAQPAYTWMFGLATYGLYTVLWSLVNLLENIAEEVGKEYGDFDLICHIAFDQPPLSRKERANNVKKRNYFTKYGEQARSVLNALLDKYADKGISTIETAKVLKLKPFSDMGTPVEIINDIFGGKDSYETALEELEQQLYKQG